MVSETGSRQRDNGHYYGLLPDPCPCQLPRFPTVPSRPTDLDDDSDLYDPAWVGAVRLFLGDVNAKLPSFESALLAPGDGLVGARVRDEIIAVDGFESFDFLGLKLERIGMLWWWWQ